MASPQFNLRLRDGLDDQVRALAAEHRVDPRDVVEDALIGHYRFRRQGPGVDPDQLRIPVPPVPAAPAATLAEPKPEIAALGGPPAVSGRGCPECGGQWVQGTEGGWFCADCVLRYEPDA